tara:strand:+ start:137 stop:466 length:330 start_codon:yes stop_codon:yes gene_type:complete
MLQATKKWIFMKISGVLLLPFMVWFMINFTSIYDADYKVIVSFFSDQPNKLLFLLFIITAFFHSALTISEIFEDYIINEKIKNVANRILYLFAIIFPIVIFILISKLTI